MVTVENLRVKQEKGAMSSSAQVSARHNKGMKINKATKKATSNRVAQGAVKQDKKVKQAKVEKQVKQSLDSLASAVKIGSLIVIGNRGTAFPLSWPSNQPTDGTPLKPFEKVRAEGISTEDMGNMHAMGKPCGLVWVDSCSWISDRANTFACYETKTALRKGIVKQIKVVLTQGEKSFPATVLVPGDWKPAHSLPIRLACADVKSGRVELTIVNDKRNAGLRYSVKLASEKTK